MDLGPGAVKGLALGWGQLAPGSAGAPGCLPVPISQFLMPPCRRNRKHCSEVAQKKLMLRPLLSSILFFRTLLPPSLSEHSLPTPAGFFWSHRFHTVLDLEGDFVMSGILAENGLKYQGFFVFFFFFVFKTTPTAYGGSQVRGPIGARAAAYTTATAMPDPSCV